jgi:hydrogenase maturation protease
MSGGVLVAGVGNIFLGDDGFGVEVARRLTALGQQGGLPDGVQVGDYGTSGMHLAYDLADAGYDTTILVDAAPRGEQPGTLTVLEVRPEDRAELASAGGPALFNGHGMQPEVVLGVLDMLGADAGRILVVACEPGSAEPGMGLSAPVEAAVGEAVALVTRLVTEAQQTASTTRSHE